jgi:outer membrane immunogenic protein
MEGASVQMMSLSATGPNASEMIKRRDVLQRAMMIASLLVLLSTGVIAQEIRSEVSVQATGFFTKDTNGNGIRQSSSDSGGVIAGYRYHINRWLAADGNYGWSHTRQTFAAPSGLAGISSNVHEITGDLALTLPFSIARLRPYVLAGTGVLIFDPHDAVGAAGFADTQTKATFVYGAGVDYDLTHNFALRAAYRGFVYKAPNYGIRGLDLDQVTHTAEPSAGVVFRF